MSYVDVIEHFIFVREVESSDFRSWFCTPESFPKVRTIPFEIGFFTIPGTNYTRLFFSYIDLYTKYLRVVVNINQLKGPSICKVMLTINNTVKYDLENMEFRVNHGLCFDDIIYMEDIIRHALR